MTSKTELIRDYLKKVRAANKELTKKEAFKDLLNRLYAGDAGIVKIVDAISAGAEATVLNIPRKDKIHRGSADTLYNQIIIEFENDLRKTLPHAKEQLAGYLLGQFRSGKGYNFTLIASDFINWRVFAPSAESIARLDTLQEHELVLEEVDSASFVLTEANAEQFYFYLDRFLFKEERRRATLKLIEEAFGYHSAVFIESFREMGKWFNEAKKYGEVQVSFREWKRFLSIAYGSFDASEQNFLIHSYLSVFSKMLAYSVVSNDDYISDEEMMGILDGSIFHSYNIQNFVENDFFHWVKSERNFHNLKKVFRLIAQEISTFDFTYVEEDVLKGVYQELIDLDTRHALGEYYTPDWLCERVVAEYDFQPADRILDPSCGSGSFLRAAIHRLREQNPALSPDDISRQVYGIDIHPLSVQIAKTTLLLTLGREVRHARQPVRLNVILANTLLAPKGVSNLFGSEFTISIDEEQFYLNTQVLEDVRLFDDALQACEDLAEMTRGKKPEAEATLQNVLRTQYRHGGLSPQVLKGFYQIYLAFKALKEKGRDSIWKFIVQNLYKPYFLAEKFDYIVGNPPWFTFNSVKNEQYQNTLQTLAEQYQVKPSRTALMPQMEIAAIFLAYCSAYFLKEKGKLAFVLPRSFFSAEQHDNTRSGTAKGFKIKQLWDLTDVSPLFRVPSCVIFAEKAEHKRALPAAGVKGLFFSARLREHNCQWAEAVPKLTETPATWYYAKQGQSSAFSTRKMKANNLENPYKKLFRNGATIFPRCFYFVDLVGETPSDWHDRLLTVSTAEGIKTDAKVPWKSIEFNHKRLESRFLFRTALARSILPFALYEPDLVALPMLIETEPNRKVVRLFMAEELQREGYLHAAAWFTDRERIWDQLKTEKSRSMTANDRLDFQRGLTEQNLDHQFLVLYNSSAKNANATVIRREDLDLEFFAENTTYWYSTANLEEAYYLSSILNSDAPNEMMKDFQAKGLFGARHVHKKILDIYYPQYDGQVEAHRRLAELGRRCHEQAAQYLADHPPPAPLGSMQLGKLRVAIKKHLVKELQEVDQVVKRLIG
jgi:hypothetical protein